MYCIIILRTSEDKIVRKKITLLNDLKAVGGKGGGGGGGGGRSCTVGLLFHTVW